MISSIAKIGLTAVAALALAAGAGSTVTRAEGELAFARGGDIYTARTDGTGVRKLTRGSIHDGAPAWSPDGERIVFVRETPGTGEIYIADAEAQLTQRPVER